MVGGTDTHYASFEGSDPASFIYVMTERMDDWNPPESNERIPCIMMIHVGHQHKEITVAAQCSLYTVETIGHVLENSDGDYGNCSMLPVHCGNNRACTGE